MKAFPQSRCHAQEDQVVIDPIVCRHRPVHVAYCITFGTACRRAGMSAAVVCGVSALGGLGML